MQDDLFERPFHRQLDDETAPLRLVVFHPHETLMIRDDGRNDG